MSFSKIVLMAVVITTVGGFQSYFGIGISYFLFSISGLVLLFAGALHFFYINKSDFDVLVASESIVGFGVASLVGGVVVSLLLFLNKFSIETPASSSWSQQDTVNLIRPFLEGLSIAALAPLLAIFLRNLESEQNKSAIHFDAVDLSHHVKSTSSNLTQLNSEIGSLTLALKKQAAEVEKAAAAASKATAGLGSAIVQDMKHLQDALMAARAEIKGIGDAAQNARVSVNEFGSGTETAKRAVSKCAIEITNMKEAATQSTTLLDGLAKLIASVKTFKEPL